MRKIRLVSGILFFLAGVLFLYGSYGVTGFAIGEDVTGTATSFLGVALLVVGLFVALTASRDENYAERALKSGKYIDNPREFKKIAKKGVYDLVEGYKEGTRVYKGDKVVTVIPNHRVSRGVSRSILEALASGKSNFRKRLGK